jgi:hypothetical protein
MRKRYFKPGPQRIDLKTVLREPGIDSDKDSELHSRRTLGGEFMKDSQSLGFRGVAMMAAAIGAVAVGAFAIGALTIRRLTIRRVVIGSAEFKTLEIRDLTVKRLRAAEVTVSDSLKLPGSDISPKISP